MASLFNINVYIYHLPVVERRQLCIILDLNNKWEELAGLFMKYDFTTISMLRQEIQRGKSPTDELLTLWGHQNHTVSELFLLLSRMKHYQAMTTIKKFVDSKLHRLIDENYIEKLEKPHRNHLEDNQIPTNNWNDVENKLLQDKNVEQLLHPKAVAQNINYETKDYNESDKKQNLKPISPTAQNARRNSAISDVAESAGAIPQISYEELQKSTDNWNQANILGKGGFGTVFKGIWKCTQVAIKRIEQKENGRESQSEQIKQSITELYCLNAYRHDNILPLYGYSVGGPQPCLVYQYMSGGCLERKLRIRDNKHVLKWKTRLDIATGTARGLQYLHTIGDKPLIHGDIKSANILLDPNDVPRIGDFGLAREGPQSGYTHLTVSRIHGTMPYLPDEFLRGTKSKMNEERLHIDWGNDKLYRTQRQVEKNPYDLESWSILLRECQIKHISEVRALYEHLILVFPSASRYWRIYIEHEMKSRNFERVEKLFQRCLMKILNIELWKLYLAYVKETKATLPTYKEKMAQAYDFALDKIGMDIHSYSIWNDYVNFLKSVEAVGSYAENQKISAVRKVYQRGVINPMIGMETFWKDYIAFEQAINPIIAEKMSIERSRDYMNARRVAKELEVQIRGINRNAPSIPPSGSNEEQKQVELWQKYIAWERSNPLRTEDTALLTRRVVFALEQCLLCLGHHPDIWYQAAQFLEYSCKVLQEKGDVNASKLFSEEAANIFERATSTLLSKNMLLYFAYADYEEGRLKYDKVHQIYQKYLDIQDIDPTLAYVQYMKFARRAEGIKSARNVFKRAREDPRSKYHIFVCAALMEYYCSKDKNIAFRIFELGLKKFSDNPDYITCYIDYLSHLNEDNNTRVLFERVLSSGSLEPEKSVDIWNRFLEFESNIGDLQSIVKVEKRRSEVLSKIKEFEGKETAQLVDRYRFLDMFPCTAAELKSIGYTEVITITGAGRNTVLHAIINSEDDSALPKPDTAQMIPYKPKANPLPGEHPIPGGTFPHPPSVAHLCTLLPPPSCFCGPFVNIDQLMDIFNRIQLPDRVPAPAENGGDVRLFDLAKSVHWIVEEGGGLGIKRRKRIGLSMDGSDDDDMPLPPMNDIYRQRQQKRVK